METHPNPSPAGYAGQEGNMSRRTRELGTGEVAEKLGRSRSHVARVAYRAGIGRLVTPRLRVYTPADVRQLAALMDPGWPESIRFKTATDS